MQLLKANTEVKVRIGPFVDVTDGYTPETGITLGAADEAELLKHNGAATVDISGATWAAVTGADGWYDLTLTTSYTDTEGLLTVVVQDDSECLPVFAHFMVMAQAAFDSMFTAKDTGYMDVNVKAVSEDTAAADNLETACDGGSYNVGGGAVVAASVTGAAGSVTGAVGSVTGNVGGNVAGSVASVTAGVSLADDAITSAKFDESTAFPLKSADTGATQVARVGADGDTLETLSDEIAAISTSGPGDYSVTITIRTTGGTSVSGVSVWVNTSNDRSGSVVQAKTTDDSGQVSFNLNYTTYYVFCHLAGYTFAAASFTASAGNVTFTKDLATAVSSGSASYYNDSFLSRAITLARETMDEPTVSEKYSDTRLIEYIEQAAMLVFNEKSRNSKTPIVVKQSITIAADTTQYVLPHVMGEFLGLYNLSDTGTKVFYDGRSRYNPFGQKVWLEGQILNIQDSGLVGVGTTLTAEWKPNGIARLHNGTCTISSDGTEVTLGATPNAGTLDTHPHAYAGSVIRILGASGSTVTGNYVQEGQVVSYDHETRVATLDVALDPIPTTDDGYIYYEIVPPIHKGMDLVIPLYAAYRIMAVEGNTKRANGILAAYRNELRNVRLNAYYSNLPEAPRVRQDNHDNRRYRRP